MIKTHEKLSKGEKTFAALLLAGLIKIINQHDGIATIENKEKV